MKRPDLTFITQNKFKTEPSIFYQAIKDSNGDDVANVVNRNFANAFAQLPELVQIAEMMYDSCPKSMMGEQILAILNKIKS